jgi:hypothetical protein
MGEPAAQPGPRVLPPTPGWVQDLPLREGPLTGKPDGWDEINHLDDKYLEWSRASDFPRGPLFSLGAFSACFGLLFPNLLIVERLNSGGVVSLLLVVLSMVFFIVFVVVLAVFFLRLDLRLPKDRPIRFNRHQGKVYINHYEWNHNPFGRWGGGVKVLDWNTLQAQITYQVGASGEVITQRYSMELVTCKPGVVAGTFEAVDRFRFQHGAQTTVQYEEMWALLRHYMNKGLQDLPPQNIRNTKPGFIDCLLFAVPWFAPTEEGRRARVRMKGFWGTLVAVLMSLLLPMWLLFGIGNYIVNLIAPEAVWPADVEALSKSAGPQAAR